MSRPRSARPVRRVGRIVASTAVALLVGVFTTASISGASGGVAANAPVGANHLQKATRITPPPTAPPTTPPTTVPRGPTLPVQVQAAFDRTNRERTTRGIPALVWHTDLAAAAAMHGNDQRNKPCTAAYLSHTGTDGSGPGQRIARTGLRVRDWAENIACGVTTGDAMVSVWMGSSGHRANILNPALTHIGISLTYSDSGRPYWVQVFALPR